MSRQVILAIASATVLSAVVPGFTGYTSAQFDAIERERGELLALRAQLGVAEVTVQPMAAGPCAVTGREPRAATEKPGAAAGPGEGAAAPGGGVEMRPAIRVPRHHRARARRHFSNHGMRTPMPAPGPPIK